MDSSVNEWIRRSRHRYLWREPDLADCLDAMAAAVAEVIDELAGRRSGFGPSFAAEEVCHENENLGLLRLSNEPDQGEDQILLYVARTRPFRDRRRTVLSAFKQTYTVHAGGAFRGEDGLFGPQIARVLMSSLAEKGEKVPPFIGHGTHDYRSKEAPPLSFDTVAKRAINRRRALSPRLRYRVLARDRSTCQLCGRSAPDVEVHVDHIDPLSWGTQVHGSDDPDDYQVLCKECNLGKGDLRWPL